VVLALAAAGLVVWYVSSLRSEEGIAEPTQVVLVAAEYIPARTSGESIVANNLVERKEIVVSSVTPGALTSEAQLQGQVLTVPVAKGQQILQTQLGAPDEQSLSYRIRTGMRAVSIAVDRRNAVGGAIKEGDRVDVIATFDADQLSAVQLIPPTTVPTVPPASPESTPTTLPPTSPMNLGLVLSPDEIARIKDLTGYDLSQAVSSVSITILQQVEVLAMDNLLPITRRSESDGVLSGGDGTTREEVPDSPVITLMVSPADAEKIVYAQTYGKITFTLIPAQDTTKVDPIGRSLPNMFR
jgi:pilus assembly protein CpaB